MVLSVNGVTYCRFEMLYYVWQTLTLTMLEIAFSVSAGVWGEVHGSNEA